MTHVEHWVAIVFDTSITWLENAVLLKAATGFEFAEGAAWHPDGFFLFSDTPANKIYRLDTDGRCEVYLDNSGWTGDGGNQLSDQVGSNGIVIDGDNLFICQHGNHAIAQLDTQKKLLTLIQEYDGHPFNSPNDLIMRSDGTLFFTDPPYGLAGQVLHPEQFQLVAGVYQYRNGVTMRIGTQLQYPNGLLLSEDEKYLFVSSNHPDDPGIVMYHTKADGYIRYEGVFLNLHADGMTRGNDGHIYLATDEGVLVVNPEGSKLALLPLPESSSNLCWGGMQRDILLVTARTSVYFIIKS